MPAWKNGMMYDAGEVIEMGYVSYNANPRAARVGDCTVRAISKAMDEDWDTTYIRLCAMGLERKDMPNANAIWGDVLKRNGFERHIIQDGCPACYTLRQFAEDHQKGTYIVALSGHVVAVKDGDYYDSWDSGDEVPIYFWSRGGEWS